MFITDKGLEEFDPELWQSISKESVRQEEHIELIASENYLSLIHISEPTRQP